MRQKYEIFFKQHKEILFFSVKIKARRSVLYFLTELLVEKIVKHK